MKNYTNSSTIDSSFDKLVTIAQNGKEIEYGIIDGNNTIIFIKAGMEGSCYGYENKYIKIGRRLNAKHGCSIISSSNPLGYQTDFDAEMAFVRDYGKSHNFNDYQVYYFGFSNGSLIGMSEAHKYSEIKRLLLVNAPLCINIVKSIDGIRKFSGEKMTLLFGSNDPSYDLAKMFTELESEKVHIEILPGIDHNFVGALDLFISLPEKYLFCQPEK